MLDNRKTLLGATLALVFFATSGFAQEKAKPATWWGGVKLGA